MQAVGHYWKRFPNKAIEYKHKYKTASCRIGRSDGINREFMKTNFKQKIIEQARREDLQVTALREQVLDIVLQQSGVIKAYNVLSQMQQQSEGVLAPPTVPLIFGRIRAFCTKWRRSTAIFCAATRSTSATTIATTTKKPKRTTARLFWSAPNAARRTSKPSATSGRHCVQALPKAVLR